GDPRQPLLFEHIAAPPGADVQAFSGCEQRLNRGSFVQDSDQTGSGYCKEPAIGCKVDLVVLRSDRPNAVPAVDERVIAADADERPGKLPVRITNLDPVQVTELFGRLRIQLQSGIGDREIAICQIRLVADAAWPCLLGNEPVAAAGL